MHVLFRNSLMQFQMMKQQHKQKLWTTHFLEKEIEKISTWIDIDNSCFTAKRLEKWSHFFIIMNFLFVWKSLKNILCFPRKWHFEEWILNNKMILIS